MIGGQITVDELAAGEIKHAIGIALVRAKKGEYSTLLADRRCFLNWYRHEKA